MTLNARRLSSRNSSCFSHFLQILLGMLFSWSFSVILLSLWNVLEQVTVEQDTVEQDTVEQNMIDILSANVSPLFFVDIDVDVDVDIE